MGLLRAAVVSVVGSLRLMLSVVGGIPGLIFTALTFALGAWMTGVDDTTAALDEHKRIMGEVISAYERVKGKTADWAKEIRNVTLDQANANLRSMIENFEAMRGKVADISSTDFFSFNDLSRSNSSQAAIAEDLRDLKKAFDQSEISAKAFVTRLTEIYKTIDDPDLQAWAEQLLDAGRGAEAAETAMGGMALTAQTLGNNSKEVAEIVDATNTTIKGLSEAAADADKSLDDLTKDGIKKFAEALGEIKELIPSLSSELKRLEEIETLDKLYKDAVNVARTMGEVNRATELYGRALKEINAKGFGGTTAQSGTIDLIKELEGFKSEAYFDRTAYRAGYGSDTVTLADGSIEKIVKGMYVAEADAMRDLVRRIGEFQDGIKSRIGSDRFSALSPDQQSAITSISYNYGSLPERIVEAFKTGSAEQIAAAIRGLGGDNDGINRGRRNTEAALFEKGGDTFKTQQLLADIEDKRATKAEEYNADLERRNAILADENANQGQLSREGFIQKAIAEEQNRAREAGVTLSDEQLARLRSLAAAEYAIIAAKRENKTEAKEANVALQHAVALSSQRNTLEKLFNDAHRNGDTESATALQTQLVDVNLKLQEAIDKARAMWEAIGGPEADVAIAKLDKLKAKSSTATGAINSLGLSTSQVKDLANSFADGIIGIFDSLAESVRNGENAVRSLGIAFLQFAADFLREIAAMTIKQQILNAIQAVTGFQVAGVPSAHAGGMVGAAMTGSGNARRSVSPAVFSFATRYHNGGIAGLRPDEVPTILKQGEEVLTEADPRHRMNGRRQRDQQQPSSQNIRNILVLDDESAANWLSSPGGERVILSTLKRNAAVVKRLLG